MAAKEKKIQTKEKSGSEMLRRFKTNPFLFIGTFLILVIVVVAFVFVPAIVPEYGGRGDVDLNFGSYDKVPISYVPGNYFSQYISLLLQNEQGNLDPENPFAFYPVWLEAFQAAAVHTAMLREMQRVGYSVPSKTVDFEVAKLPRFQENGRFSSVLYKRMDENSRLTLWQQVQDDIIKNRFPRITCSLINSITFYIHCEFNVWSLIFKFIYRKSRDFITTLIHMHLFLVYLYMTSILQVVCLFDSILYLACF